MRPAFGVALSPGHNDRIAWYARGALLAAEALDRIPTPLDDINEALRLGCPKELFELGDAPPRLQRIIRKLRGKVLGALSVRERVIYIDRSQSRERQRFTHAHELGHDALPHHRDAYFGDDRYTLHPDTRVLLESEASRFGADVLFQLDRFAEMAAESRLGLAVPLELAATFETSRHASIRRYVETNPRACALLVFGKYPVHPGGRRSLKVLMALESPAFKDRYGAIATLVPSSLAVDDSALARDAYQAIRGATAEPVISGSTGVAGTKRGAIKFAYEIFSNTHAAFALLYQPLLSLGRKVTAHWAPGDDAA